MQDLKRAAMTTAMLTPLINDVIAPEFLSGKIDLLRFRWEPFRLMFTAVIEVMSRTDDEESLEYLLLFGYGFLKACRLFNDCDLAAAEKAFLADRTLAPVSSYILSQVRTSGQGSEPLMRFLICLFHAFHAELIEHGSTNPIANYSGPVMGPDDPNGWKLRGKITLCAFGDLEPLIGLDSPDVINEFRVREAALINAAKAVKAIRLTPGTPGGK